ncbi:hypothetical protein ACFE04_000154 [Oxalis oulophora]
MGEGRIDVNKLISLSNDLVKVLKDKTDLNNSSHCFNQFNTLQSSCNSDFDEVNSSILDYQIKIDECKRKLEEAKIDVADQTEEDALQNQLQQEVEKELIVDEIADLEHERFSIEQRNKTLRTLEKEAFKSERMLSMYASVTNIIPNLDDQFKISGYIVDKDKNKVEKFEVDPSKSTPSGTCGSIWKLIEIKKGEELEDYVCLMDMSEGRTRLEATPKLINFSFSLKQVLEANLIHRNSINNWRIVKELEQLLQSLEAHNQRSNVPLFSEYFSFPQFSTQRKNSANESAAHTADVEVTMVEEGCQLSTVNKVATVVHDLMHTIQEEYSA